MRENNTPEITDLIIGFLSENNTAAENKHLYDWIIQSEENRLLFLRIRNAWQVSVQMPVDEKTDSSTALEKVHKRIQPVRKKIVLGGWGASFVKIAASILVLFSVGLNLFNYLSTEEKESSPATELCKIIVPKGSKTITELPDGTRVWLNAGSNLTYQPSSFNKNSREVTLTGEAYFKVTTNPKKPFIVKAKNIDVKAFGTEFNVKAYPDEDIVETTLVHGKVKIEGKNKGNFTIDMKPNQKITCFTGTVKSSNQSDNSQQLSKKNDENENIDITPVAPQVQNDVKTDLYTSWKDNKWIIEGEKIGDLAVILERKFNVSIKFDSEKLKNYVFTGTFQNETLEQVLQVLKLTAPIIYEMGKGEVIIKIDSRIQTKYEKYIN